jgi:hypothetical protein
MLLFTLISNKVNYLMTPEVLATGPRPNRIGYDIYSSGVYRDGAVTFQLSLTNEALIETGDEVTVSFVNMRDRLTATVAEKVFDEESQTVSVTATTGDGDTEAYDGQFAEVTFYYLSGNYPRVLPKTAVISERGESVVYVVRTVNSVFGEREIVNRRVVTLLDQDEFNAAVEGINDNDVVVYDTTKPLTEEAAVRVLQ